MIQMDTNLDKILDVMGRCLMQLNDIEDIYDINEGLFVTTKNEAGDKVLLMRLYSFTEEEYNKLREEQ